MGVFASQSPGVEDDLLLIDSTPVECARSRETVKRSQLADAADYGYCASHSRFFSGFRLHAPVLPRWHTEGDRSSTSPKLDEREVGAEAARSREAATARSRVIGDKGYAGNEFASKASELDATIVRPRRKDEPGRGPHLAPIRQRIESIFWTCKDILTLERHGAARTRRWPARAHPATPLTLDSRRSALKHQLGRPSRARQLRRAIARGGDH